MLKTPKAAVAILAGIAVGLLIGKLTEIYTSEKYGSVKTEMAEAPASS